MTRWGFLAAALLAIAGCAQPEPRYVVGDPYRLGGVWSYPQEDYALSETGLAEVLPAPMFGGQTANGEVLMAQGLTAAHRSLQMPAIIRVTNLENGRSMLLRVNDRGPEKPGRILGVSPRAGALLGMTPDVPRKSRCWWMLRKAARRRKACPARRRPPLPLPPPRVLRWRGRNWRPCRARAKRRGGKYSLCPALRPLPNSRPKGAAPWHPSRKP